MNPKKELLWGLWVRPLYYVTPRAGIEKIPLKEAYIDLIGVVVKIMVPFWVPNIVRHLIFRVPQKGP